MVIQDDIITLNKKDARAIIEKECKKRLQMSSKEFMQKRSRGELPKSIAVHDIEMLLKLA